MKTSVPVKHVALIASVLLLALAAGRGAGTPTTAFFEIVCVVAFLFVLFTLRAAPQPQMQAQLSWSIAFALGAAAALAGARGWIDGTPAFQHDWKWPLDAIQSRDQLQTLNSLWLAWGTGAPAIQALGNYPITIAGWLLGLALPTNFALLAVLALIGGCAASGIAYLGAITGLSRSYQIALALCVAATPAWFNRIDAGHVEWLLGYALFPWALATAIAEAKWWRTAGALGALWGLAGGQAQFMLFFPLSSLPFLARGRRIIGGAFACVLMAALQLPAIVAMAFALHANAFAAQHTNLTWQSAQSDPLALALISGADPAHYFLQWQTTLGFALALVPLALAAIGAAAFPVTRVLGVLWLTSALWSSGLDGPLRTPIAWLFTHVPDAIAFREFAHAQALTASLVLILAAHGTAAVVSRLRLAPPAGAALLFATLLPLTFASYSGESTRIARPVAASGARDAIVRDVRKLRGSGQVLWWPGLDAIAWEGPVTRGGVDSEAFPTGTHAPYVEYRPTAALAHAITASAAGNRATCGLLGDLGVQAVVLRDEIRMSSGSAFSSIPIPGADVLRRDGLILTAVHGQYRLYVVPCYRGRFTIAHDALLQGDWSSLERAARTSGATDERTEPPPPPRGCRAQRFDAATYRSTDIASDWVPISEADAYFLSFDDAFGDVLVTGNPANTVRQWVLAAPPHAGFSWMSPSRFNALLPDTAAVWESATCRVAPRPATARVEFSRSLSFHDGLFVLQNPSLVVAHYASYAGWTLWANGNPGRKPTLADGYATGWLLPRGAWRLAIVPAGPPIALLWVIAGIAGVICLLLVAVRKHT